MAVETTLITFALNNGVGVLFGLLLYKMADNQRIQNAKAIDGLKEAMNNLADVLSRMNK